MAKYDAPGYQAQTAGQSDTPIASGNRAQPNSRGLAYTTASEALAKTPEQSKVSVPAEPVPPEFQGYVEDKTHVPRTAAGLEGALLDPSNFELDAEARLSARHATLNPEPVLTDSRTVRDTLSPPDTPVCPDPQVRGRDRVQTSLTTAGIVDCVAKPNVMKSCAITETPDQSSSRSAESLPPDPQFHVRDRLQTSIITAEIVDCMTKPSLTESCATTEAPDQSSPRSAESLPPDPQFHVRDRLQTSIITAEAVDCMTRPNITRSSAITETPKRPFSRNTKPVPPDHQFHVHDRVRTSRITAAVANCVVEPNPWRPNAMNRTLNEPAYQDTKITPADPQYHARDGLHASITTAEKVDCRTEPNITESGETSKTPNEPTYRDTELVPPDHQFHVHNRVRTSRITSEVATCMVEPNPWRSDTMNKTLNEPAYHDAKLAPVDPQYHARDGLHTSITTAEKVDCRTEPNITECSETSKTSNGPTYRDTELVPPDPEFHVHIRVRTFSVTAEVVGYVTEPHLWKPGAINETPDQPAPQNTKLVPPDSQLHVHEGVEASGIDAEIGGLMTTPDTLLPDERDKTPDEPASPRTEPVPPDPRFHENGRAQTCNITSEVVDCMTKPHLWESLAIGKTHAKPAPPDTEPDPQSSHDHRKTWTPIDATSFPKMAGLVLSPPPEDLESRPVTCRDLTTLDIGGFPDSVGGIACRVLYEPPEMSTGPYAPIICIALTRAHFDLSVKERIEMRVPVYLIDGESEVPAIQDHELCRATISHVSAGSTSISITDDFMAYRDAGEDDRSRLPPDKDTVFPKGVCHTSSRKIVQTTDLRCPMRDDWSPSGSTTTHQPIPCLFHGWLIHEEEERRNETRN